MARFSDARILLVDDSQDLVFIMERILADEGYKEVVSTTDARKVVDLYGVLRPDLILLDLHMPGMNGFDVMAALKEAGIDGAVPIVMLTGDASPEAKLRGLRGGARDYLTKPFDKTEVHLRIENLLEMRFMHRELARQNELLEMRVEARTRELESAKQEILQRLAMAAEFRDDETGHHTQRVGRLSSLMAEALRLNDTQVELIGAAAPLHDVGKIGVPDEILLKPGRLTPKEWEIMKTHTTTGARLLSKSVSPVLQLGEKIALTHHEKWDGSGYRGLRGTDIPLSGRIVAVADAFDAMTHDRPYKDAISAEEATEEIVRGSDSHFCPLAVTAFLDCKDYAHRIDVRLGAAAAG
jgi:putative two-component system response regulator